MAGRLAAMAESRRMSSDAIDLLFDWRDERREANREEDGVVEVGKNGRTLKPWPPREVTEEELASGPTKACSRCGVTYPATKEFYRWRNQCTYHHRSRGLQRRKGGFLRLCLGCDRTQRRKRRYENQHPFRVRCYRIKAEGVKRNIEWGFDNREDLREFWDAPCHYCGGEVEQRLGLDRIENDKGYIPGNVVQCCLTCNRMKTVLSVDEWVAHMRKVLEHLESSDAQ